MFSHWFAGEQRRRIFSFHGAIGGRVLPCRQQDSRAGIRAVGNRMRSCSVTFYPPNSVVPNSEVLRDCGDESLTLRGLSIRGIRNPKPCLNVKIYHSTDSTCAWVLRDSVCILSGRRWKPNNEQKVSSIPVLVFCVSSSENLSCSRKTSVDRR